MIQTLTVTREKKSTYNCVSTLRDSNGFVKAILTGYSKQPKKTQKTIEIQNKIYNLKFVN